MADIDTNIARAAHALQACNLILGAYQQKPSPNNPRTYNEAVSRLESSPATSYWLMEAVRDLNQRDPVDALNDAEALLHVVKMRYREICG